MDSFHSALLGEKVYNLLYGVGHIINKTPEYVHILFSEGREALFDYNGEFIREIKKEN